MIKMLLLSCLWTIVSINSYAQIKIHSHNDYAQKTPFLTAYTNKVEEIEADIFVINDSIFVAHGKKEIKANNTLSRLYLEPIAQAFKAHNGKVSDDKNYTFTLMIDVKENWNEVYPVLKREIEQYGNIFNRTESKNAIQIAISGARPDHSTFNTYPKWLFFDGLPEINYSKKDLKYVMMISDNFSKYSKWRGIGELPEADKVKLKKAIEAAHQLKKPIRFWGAPDTEACWKQLAALGADIINTDKISESKLYFANGL